MRDLAWKYASVYWCIGLLAAALLFALSVKPSALTNSSAHAGASVGTVGTTVMGRGGQLEKPPVW
jgi:hypothetical protein